MPFVISRQSNTYIAAKDGTLTAMPRPASQNTIYAYQNAAKASLHPKTILRRLRAGWSPAEAIGEQERPKAKRGPKTQLSLMPDYASRYHAKRRALAISNGICCECNADPAEEGKTRCNGCLEVGRLRYHSRKAA